MKKKIISILLIIVIFISISLTTFAEKVINCPRCGFWLCVIRCSGDYYPPVQYGNKCYRELLCEYAIYRYGTIIQCYHCPYYDNNYMKHDHKEQH